MSAEAQFGFRKVRTETVRVRASSECRAKCVFATRHESNVKTLLLPLPLAGVCLAVAILVSLRPLGIDRDYLEYWLYYYGEVDRGSRIDASGLGLGWRVLKSLNIPFYTVLCITTFIALLPKFQTAWVWRKPWLWMLTYVAIFLPLHEYTQVRLALAVGFALAFINRTFARGRCDLLGFAAAACAAWIHPSLLPIVPAAVCWPLFASYPYAALVLFVTPALLPAAFFARAVALLHPEYAWSAQNYDFQNQAFNLFSVRNVVLAFVLCLAIYELRRLPAPMRALVALSACLFGLGVRWSEEPVIAHRSIELALMFPPLWFPCMRAWFRKSSTIVYCLLICTYLYLLYIDPSFFAGAAPQ